MFLHMSDLGEEPQTIENPQTGAMEEHDPIAVWDDEQNTAVPYSVATSARLSGISEVNGINVQTVFDITKLAAAEYPLSKTSEITGIPEDTIQELARIYHEDGPVYTHSMFGADHYSNGT